MSDQSLKQLIKSLQLPVREYVKNLESQIAKLQKQKAKFECNDMSQRHEIAALKKQLSACLKKGHITVLVNRNVSKNS